MSKVSVLMPVYNGEKYIKDSIVSILSQTYTNLELIIIDDGSVDSTGSIITSIKDERIKFFKNDQNRGIVYSRNRALQLATGDFYAILDSDDIALPQRIEKQVQFLETHSDYGLVGTYAKVIDENGTDQNEVIKFPTDSNVIKAFMIVENAFVHSAVMMRKEAFPQVPYKSEFEICEDYELWVRISETWKIANLDEILVLYRIHSNNISKNTKRVDAVGFKILEYQINRICPLQQHELLQLFNLVRRRFENSFNYLTESEKLLSKIYQCNIESKVVSVEEFGIQLSRIIDDLIGFGKLYNKDSIRLIKQSPLGKYLFADRATRFKYFRRSLKSYLRFSK